MRQLKWSLLAAYSAGCALAWPLLPARFPFHFNGRGIVDSWAAKSVAAWFALPALMAGVLLLMELTITWSIRRPALWNGPEKQRFLALTEAQRAPIYAELRNMMDAIGIAMIMLFGAMQWLMLSVARHQETHLPSYFIFIMIAFTVGVLLYTIRFSIKLKPLILSAAGSDQIGRLG